MQPITDKNLNYWANIYLRLDSEYQLFMHSGMSFELFIKRPDFYHHWIVMYLSNRRLFEREEGEISLVQFLTYPENIFTEAVARHANNETISNDFLPLLLSQNIAAKVQGIMYQHGIQEIYERFNFNHRKRDMELRGNRLMEPFHHYAPCKRHKVGRRAHV